MKAIEAWDDKFNEWGIVTLGVGGTPLPLVGTRGVDSFLMYVKMATGVSTDTEILESLSSQNNRKIRLVDYITPVVLCETGDPGQ